MASASSVPADWLNSFIGVAVFVALVMDICFQDKSKKLDSKAKRLLTRIKHFERWVKRLPVQEVMTWHLNYISEKIDAVIWKKHPYWICFIVGFLLTAMFSAHSIIVYGYENQEPLRKAGITADMLPQSSILDPIPADVLGGLFFVAGRKIIRSRYRRNILFLYGCILLGKIMTFLLVFMAIAGGMLRGAFSYALHADHDANSTIGAQYAVGGFVSSLAYLCLCTVNAFVVLDMFLYLLEFSVILWLTVYLAIFISKVLRWCIGKARNMYFTGAVSAVAFVCKAIEYYQTYIHFDQWTLYQRSLVGFYLGFGH